MRIGRTYWTLQRWIAPGLTNSQDAYRDSLLSHLANRPRWLDLGCGHQFLPDWAWTPDPQLLSRLPRVAGVDADLGSLRRHASLKYRVGGDISRLPFAAESFDLVTANMVMEHVADPERTLEEVSRVLAPGGLFLFHTPNVASPLVFLAARLPDRFVKLVVRVLEGRAEEDVYPTVYGINTRARVAELGGRAGFRLERAQLAANGALTASLGPLALFELLCIRITGWRRFHFLRPAIIAALRKPHGETSRAAAMGGNGTGGAAA
ncbi:MAG: class I SAM-dependent methyltransferase [Acidobacteriia bacterium]|nr:class I SAM-dependent methyltransferase [Terriglobia bacterium]